MKKLLQAVFVFLTPSLAFSQNSFFEISDAPIFNCGIDKVINDGNGYFYSVSSPKSAWAGFGETGFIYKTDRNGIGVFRKPFQFGDATYLEDVSLTPDNNLILCGFSQGCDWFPSRQGLLIKIDQQGDTLWTRQVNPDTINNFLDNHLHKILVLNDGSLVTTADSTVYKTDSAGILQWQLPLAGTITSLGNALNDLFFIGTYAGLYTIDTSGNILSVNPSFHYYNGFLSDSTYLFSASGNLVKTDTSFSVIGQFSFSSINFPGDLVHIHHDTIWATGKYASDFISLDINLNILDTFRTQTSGVVVNSFSIFDTTIVVAGLELGEKNYIYFKSYSTNGNYSYYPYDLALIDVSFDTSYAVPYIPNSMICRIKFLPAIEVQNNGLDTINSFYVSALSLTNGVCGPFQYHRLFNTSLPPGQTQSFVLDTLYEVLGIGIGFTYHFCPWISCPDLKVDKDHSNDYLCDSFVINDIVTIKAIDEEKIISIYPNPTSSSFIVSRKAESPALLDMFNELGEKVYSALLRKDKETINAKLNPGVYFIIINDGKKRFTAKQIVE